MTRIRFIEWLFAAVLVVAIHGLALTGWAWLEPGNDLGGVRLPEKIKTAAAPTTAAIPLSVTVIGEKQASVPVAAATPAPVTSSSNEIIVVPTEPTNPLGSGQSTVVLAPPPPIDASQPTMSLQLPTLDQDEPAEQDPPASARESSGVSPLRDPVPLPKSKPDLDGPPAPPAPPSADRSSPTTPVDVATLTAPGGTDQAPSTGPSATSEPISAAQSTYYRVLLAEIRKAQIYPDAARRENKTGTVYLQIVVDRTGKIKSYDIVKSSGFQELDDAAVQSLVKANPVPPFPDGIGDNELRFGLPMRFGS